VESLLSSKPAVTLWAMKVIPTNAKNICVVNIYHSFVVVGAFKVNWQKSNWEFC